MRIEIASALQRDIPVIPVLIDGASMPREAELPGDLTSLARRHALELRHTRFASDAEAIVAALRAALPKAKKSLLWQLVAAAAAACIVIGGAVWWLAPFGPTPPKQVAEAPSQPAAAAKPAAPTSVEEAQRKVAEASAKIAALQGNMAAPNAAAQTAPPADAKPMPAMEGVPVALGDPFDAVKQVYPTAGQSGAGDLAMPLDGIRLFFTKDDRVLREIMLEAPYAGNVAGLRIGDSASDVVARLGQPYAVAEIYGGSGYLYHAGGNILRYDLDKSNKVNAIVQILDRE